MAFVAVELRFARVESGSVRGIADAYARLEKEVTRRHSSH